MTRLYQNLQFGVRLFAKSPGFTAVALITLALGIGANAAIFSIVNAVMLHPLPYRDADQLLWLSASNNETGQTGIQVSYTRFDQVQQQSRTLNGIGVFYPLTLSMLTNGDPEAIPAARASESLFRVLGASPGLGRGFLPAEDRVGASEVAVVSDAFWRTHLAADPNAIGKSLALDGRSATVVGVLPASFQFPFLQRETAIWLTRPIDNPGLGADKINSGAGYLFAIGRAKQPHMVQAELDILAARYKERFPGYVDAGKLFLKAIPLEENLLGSLRSSLLVLLGAVGLVLLIACVNVASLLLARATARQREIAIRVALGASRQNIIHQLLTESLLLALLGGALGVGAAYWLLPVLMRYAGSSVLPRAGDVRIDSTVLLFSALLCCATGLIFGIGPALQVSRGTLSDTLKQGGRGSTSARGGFRELVVVGEVTIALVLMTGAGLLIKSFVNLMRVNPGFDPAHVMTFPLSLSPTRYSKPEQRAEFYRKLDQTVRQIPGVDSAAVTNFLPLSGGGRFVFFCPEGHVCRGLGKDNIISSREITPGYFQTMHTPLLRGRLFTDSDRAGSPRIAIINATTAKREFQNDALGKHIANSRDMVFMEIVGVVADAKLNALSTEVPEEMYMPAAQSPPATATLLVRSNSASGSLISDVRHAVHVADPTLALTGILSMDDVVSLSVGQPRLVAQLVGGFAALALTLAAIGIYGLMAYFVSQRNLEIAVRIALGAGSKDVFGLIVGQGMRLVGIGIVLGVLASLAFARMLASLLFGTGSTDAATLIGSSALFIAAALAACYIPARRAVRVDAMSTLRSQ